MSTFPTGTSNSIMPFKKLINLSNKFNKLNKLLDRHQELRYVALLAPKMPQTQWTKAGVPHQKHAERDQYFTRCTDHGMWLSYCQLQAASIHFP